MKSKSIDEGKRLLQQEAEAILNAAERLDEEFEKAVEIIFACTGKVICTGVGKSGLIARKIAATLASTGTTALFLHPVEGLHGDLGMIQPNDVSLILSNSGETPELLEILPALKRLGEKIITLTGKPFSTLAENSDAVLDGRVACEACPFNLVPTTSTTLALAIGDALAISLLKRRGFTAEDYAKFHPAGVLGKRMLLRIADIMKSGEEMPAADENLAVREAIVIMTEKRMGAVLITNQDGALSGIITDHDLRKALQRTGDVGSLRCVEIMTKAPKTISPVKLAAEAIPIMENPLGAKISVLPVVDEQNFPVGIIHLHDIIKAGI